MSRPDLQLRTDQIGDLAVYMAQPRVLNLSDAGAGKTPPVCVMQWWMWSEKGVGTVWVMPLSLLAKNKQELHDWTDFEDDEVVIVGNDDTLWPNKPGGTSAAKVVIDALRRGEALTSRQRATLNALKRKGFVNDDLTVNEKRVHACQNGIPRCVLEPGRAKVFLMGPDRFASVWHALPEFVKAVHVDEWHKCFKLDSSARTQQLYECMRRMDWFIPMTGTILAGRLDAAYPAIKIIEPRYYHSYKGFLEYHEEKDLYSGKRTGWRNHDKIAEIFRRHGIRHTFREVHGDTAIVVMPEYVPMSAVQRELYDRFKEDAFLELDRFFVDGTLPGVAFQRARQIMEHPNQFPDLTAPGKWVDIMPGELPGKEQRLDFHFSDHLETGKPLIVYAAMVPQQYRLHRQAEAAGLRVALINGDTPPKERGRIDFAFQAGEFNTLICSPEVADVGFNWQFCGDQETEHVVFASLPFLDSTTWQAIRRTIRKKRSAPLRITPQFYENSLDQRIAWIIHQKSLEAHKVDPTMPIVNLTHYSSTTGGSLH